MVEENSKPRELNLAQLKSGFVIYNGKVFGGSDWIVTNIVELYLIGLWRPTREECEKLLKKMQIAERLRQWSLMCEEKVDWKNHNQVKFYLYLEVSEKAIVTGKTVVLNGTNIHFTDYFILQRAIADIGEDVLINEYFVEV
jgi:hypothetical protein